MAGAQEGTPGSHPLWAHTPHTPGSRHGEPGRAGRRESWHCSGPLVLAAEVIFKVPSTCFLPVLPQTLTSGTERFECKHRVFTT